MIETEYGQCGREDVHAEHQTAKREGAPYLVDGQPQANIIWQKICPGVSTSSAEEGGE